MSTKDNFAQAMKELLNGEVEVPVEKEEKKPAPSSFSSFSQPEPKPMQQQEPAEDEGEEIVEVIEVERAYQSAVISPPPLPRMTPAPAPAPAPEYRAAAFSAPVQNSYQPATMPRSMPTASGPATTETTIIAPGTTIVGDMTTAGGLRVGGEIKGNLKVASMMELNGKVIGDIEAADAVIIGSTVRGNVVVSNVLTMDGDTIIVGDVTAKNVDINGKIKGNLSVEERGHFQQDAVLVGNLMSGTVIIDEGAMLKGDISITSAQTENVTVDEPEFDIG